MWNVKNKSVPILVEYLDYSRKNPNNISYESLNSEFEKKV